MLLVVICSMFTANFVENRSLDKQMHNHARSRTRALARMRAMCEHEKYVVLDTYGES
jgi:hypothetical protein